LAVLSEFRKPKFMSDIANIMPHRNLLMVRFTRKLIGIHKLIINVHNIFLLW